MNEGDDQGHGDFYEGMTDLMGNHAFSASKLLWYVGFHQQSYPLVIHVIIT